jgi:hypothetical protein
VCCVSEPTVEALEVEGVKEFERLTVVEGVAEDEAAFVFLVVAGEEGAEAKVELVAMGGDSMEGRTMDDPGARGRVRPAPGLLLRGALISKRTGPSDLAGAAAVAAGVFFAALLFVDADFFMPETAAGGLETVVGPPARAGEVVDLEIVLVDLVDLVVLDRLTAADAEGGGL